MVQPKVKFCDTWLSDKGVTKFQQECSDKHAVISCETSAGVGASF